MGKHDRIPTGHKHSEPILENEEKRKAMLLYMLCTRMHDVEVKYSKDRYENVYVNIDGRMSKGEYNVLWNDYLEATKDIYYAKL